MGDYHIKISVQIVIAKQNVHIFLLITQKHTKQKMCTLEVTQDRQKLASKLGYH